MSSACFRPGGLELTQRLFAKLGEESTAKTNLFAEQPKSFAGAKVLDAGCGQGLTVEWLQKQGYDSWGIDRVCPVDAGKMRLVQGDLCHLPFADNSFAMVLSECSLSVCGDIRAAVAECSRVLQPSGILLVADVYFRGDTLPVFDDNRPITEEDWDRCFSAHGLQLWHREEVSAYWKPFVIEQLWAGRTMKELWSGCPAMNMQLEQQFQPGYLLFWAVKG